MSAPSAGIINEPKASPARSNLRITISLFECGERMGSPQTIGDPMVTLARKRAGPLKNHRPRLTKKMAMLRTIEAPPVNSTPGVGEPKSSQVEHSDSPGE